MKLATGANMSILGIADDVKTPIEFQSKLCMMVGRIAELDSSKRLVDVEVVCSTGYSFGKMYLTHRYFA
jgi:hypothetical protein